jgi:hypothetical protein
MSVMSVIVFIVSQLWFSFVSISCHEKGIDLNDSHGFILNYNRWFPPGLVVLGPAICFFSITVDRLKDSKASSYGQNTSET